MKLFKSDNKDEQVDENGRKVINLNAILLVAVIAINIICYRFLPENMVSHLGINGEFTGSIQKSTFVPILPGIMSVFTVWSFFGKEKQKKELMIGNVAIFLVDILFLIKNLGWI